MRHAPALILAVYFAAVLGLVAWVLWRVVVPLPSLIP